jgi:hypothetical protein
MGRTEALHGSHFPRFFHVWVSGSRVFSVCSPDNVQLEIYDFSTRGHAEYLSERIDDELGGLRYLSFVGAKAQCPWQFFNLKYMCSCGYGAVFYLVSVGSPYENEAIVQCSEDNIHFEHIRTFG